MKNLDTTTASILCNLNENEIKVLKALVNEQNRCAGGDFGYMEDVERGEFTRHEFAGYIGSLTQKDVFDYNDTTGREFHGQYCVGRSYYELLA